MKWLLLALSASLVVAGDDDDDDYVMTIKPVPVHPEHKTEKYTETKIQKETQYHILTETVEIPESHKEIETVRIPEPYTITSTRYKDIPSPTTLYQELPTTLYQTTPTTIYLTETDTLTSLTTEPVVTVFITTTTIEAQPPVTLTTTEVSTTRQCEFCKIDIYATALVFPTSYTFSTVYETTFDVYKTVYDDLNQTVYSTSTILAPTACVEPLVTTWERFGVVLTSPTTYLAYTNFSRGFLEPRATVYGCGELVSVPLELGAAATSFEELIIETTIIPSTPTEAPLQLLRYLDTIPTVVAQLSGVPAFSCDLPTVSGVATPESQVTAVAATTVPGATVRKKQAQHVLGALASRIAAIATSTAVSISIPIPTVEVR